MSDAHTSHTATGPITICEVSFAQAWNLRGDPETSQWIAPAQRAFGLDPPLLPGTASLATDRAMLWMGPQSWLWLAESPLVDFLSARNALNATGAALFDVSASYVMWRLSGTAVARVLNRMCPLDLHDLAFPAGRCAQSLLGHIGAMFYRPSTLGAFLLLVPRSYAEDAWAHLGASAAAEGHVTGPAMAFQAALA